MKYETELIDRDDETSDRLYIEKVAMLLRQPALTSQSHVRMVYSAACRVVNLVISHRDCGTKCVRRRLEDVVQRRRHRVTTNEQS